MNLSKELKKWRGVTKQRPGGRPPSGEFTQAEAAERLRVNLRTYQDWEQGRSVPKGIALQAVLERIK